MERKTTSDILFS